MCGFFSFLTNGSGRRLYMNWDARQQLLVLNPYDYNPDSHSSIAKFHSAVEDRLNKYEYNPLTGEFTVDQINAKRDDHAAAEKWVKALDFKTVCEPLIIKKIIHPLRDFDRDSVTPDEIGLLRQWASVWDSVLASVRASVGVSVGDSVGASVGDSVWASVGDSVWDSVRASVGVSVWASVWDSVGVSVGASVRASVGVSVWAYISSFFAIKYKHDFSACIKLWESGLVPSFDGLTWRLHGGKNSAILYQISAKELDGAS